MAALFAPASTVLAQHVVQVLGLRSQKQMVGADASGSVAPVANNHSVRNLAERKFPRDSRCSQALPIMPTGRDCAVAAPIFSARPKPASRCDIAYDLWPEPLRQRLRFHIRAATSRAAQRYLGRWARVRDAATRARPDYRHGPRFMYALYWGEL